MIEFNATILRKQDDLPRYVIVKAKHLGGRVDAFSAQVQLNGCKAFERSIRPWGKGSDVFFFNLTAVQCKKAGVDTGSVCCVTVSPHT
ncbi:hypothetical protein [Aliiroseovarius sp. 2305UL8-7]|uniref:hypothetical protein n=1 Tax=Aliiroseovarius conchicola TaxID=3121637 RepID=UPI0035287605